MTSNLTYSIFYNKTDWFRFLYHIKNCNYLNDINAFFFKMGTEGGDHIEFTVNVNEKSKIKIAKDISDFFLAFLKNTPSSPVNVKPSQQSYYLDFPNNTIHYGVHDYPVNEKELLLHHMLSKVIISIFNEYQAETLNSLTEILIQIFVIYSQFSAKEIDELIIYFQDLRSNESYGYEETSLLKQQKEDLDNFKQNKDAIVPYLEESILNKDNIPMKGWEKDLLDLFKLSDEFKDGVAEEILLALYYNIGYEKFTAIIYMLEGLVSLKRSNL